MNKDDIIISLLKEIDQNVTKSGGGSTPSPGINPDELIPLDPLPTPPEDTLYYRTYVDDVVYIGPNGGYSGYAGVDSLGNIYVNHKGVFTIENLKESLESPSAQVGVLNDLITEISVPDNVNILGRAPSKNLKTIIANNVWEMSQNFKGTLWYTQKEQGPVKLGSLLFGYKGTVPAEIPLKVTQDVKNINSSAFIGTDLETITLSDSIEKVGTKAFYETPFIQTFQDQPIYFGKTLYDITGTFTADTFDIPEGIKYINTLGQNVMPSGTSGYDPSGDSGVGDTETREFFNVSINRINIPSTAILTDNPFRGVKDLTYLGFPQTLPTMSEYWLRNGGSSDPSAATGVMQAYYDGTIQQFKDQLLITGSEWIDNSSIVVVYCTDGEYWLEDIELLKYTTVDGSTLPGSFGYGNLVFKDSSFNMNDISNADYIETLILPSCVEDMRQINNHQNIKSIDLSETLLTGLYNSAFLDNYNLETLVLPYNNFYYLGDNVIVRCYSLSNVYYNGTVDEFNNIGKDSQWFDKIPFDYVICSDGKVQVASIIKYTTQNGEACNCTNYDYVYYYDGQGICCLTDNTIPDNLFSNCTNLTSVEIPDYITSIGDGAFAKCSSLTSVTINSDAIVNTAYSYNYSILNIFGSQVTEYIIGDKVTSIGDGAFAFCTSLTSITIPNSVTSIGGSAFYDCNYLTSITIPNSVTSIGNSAFQNCTSLTSITIPNSVTKIGGYTFYGCSSLTSITIPDSVTSIGNYTFYNCSSLTSITIPESVISIGSYTFQNCSSLTSITIPNGVTSIEKLAFSGCSSLSSVTLGSGVQSIGTEAFRDCSSLTSITFQGTKEEWSVVNKGMLWRLNVPATEVICTDGTVTL